MIGLNNKKIGFIVDSSSNIKNNKFDDVTVVPLCITVTETDGTIKTYKDGVDFGLIELADALKNNKDVKTSQANMNDMYKVCDDMCSKYDYVIVLPIHEKLSSNYNSWKLVKDDYPNLILLMSYDITSSFEWTIEELKKYLATHDCNEAQIQEYLNNEISCNRVGFLMVTNLKQLVKGGRVSGVKAALAKLFKINPIILFDKNGLTNFEKTTNNEKFFKIIDEYISKNFSGKKINKTFLAYPAINENVLKELSTDFIKHYGNVHFVPTIFPTAVVAHTGLEHVAVYLELK